jgi:hypothetical protein
MKILLDIYFKFFKLFFNKLPIPTNKTKKSNWDWLKLDKNETFTKVLGSFVFYGFFGICLIIFKYCIKNFLNYKYLNIEQALIGISKLQILYNTLEIVYFIAWFLTLFIIVKNHNKKPLIQKIK